MRARIFSSGGVLVLGFLVSPEAVVIGQAFVADVAGWFAVKVYIISR